MLTETTGDIWSFLGTHRIVIPTNCQGAMGRGLACQAKARYPLLEPRYKDYLRFLGDRERQRMPCCLEDITPDLILFPSKEHWSERADLDLIRSNLAALVCWAEHSMAIPELGCGFGERSWEEVFPLFDVLNEQAGDYLIVRPEAALAERYGQSFRSASRRDRRFISS